MSIVLRSVGRTTGHLSYHWKPLVIIRGGFVITWLPHIAPVPHAAPTHSATSRDTCQPGSYRPSASIGAKFQRRLGKCSNQEVPDAFRSIYHSLSRVKTGGDADHLLSIPEPIVWKEASLLDASSFPCPLPLTFYKLL